MKSTTIIIPLAAVALFPPSSTAFSTSNRHPSGSTAPKLSSHLTLRVASKNENISSIATIALADRGDTTGLRCREGDEHRPASWALYQGGRQRGRRRALTTTTFALTLALSPLVFHTPLTNAYEESDYASETVTTVVSQLKSSAGKVEETFTTLEEMAKIITEGKGVGGTLTFDGVKLNEGVVADEDTTIYNPGLTLLTSSEKERLVSAIVQNRKVGLSVTNQQGWSENNEYAFDFLKSKLDPLHMYELGGYLKVVPFWGAFLYLVAIFVQQNARGIFPLVYGLCALGVFGPA